MTSNSPESSTTDASTMRRGSVAASEPFHAPIVGPAARAMAPTAVMQRALHGTVTRTHGAFGVLLAVEEPTTLIQRGRTDESVESLHALMHTLRARMIQLALSKVSVRVFQDDPPWLRATGYKAMICPLRTQAGRPAALFAVFKLRHEPNFNAADRAALLYASSQFPDRVLNTLLATVTLEPALAIEPEPPRSATPIEPAETTPEGRVRAALRTNGFALHAQRIEPLRDAARPRRHEVLVRMTEGEELLSPHMFFDAAAAHDLLPALDRWVISRLLRTLGPHAQALRHSGHELSVNVSAQSLVRRSFGDFIESQARAGLPLHALVLEFAERDILQHHAAFEQLAPRLHDLGCRIALDNCRQGLDVFAAIHRLPIHCLKIDASLTRHIASDDRAARSVRELAEVTSDIGIETVAERIEDMSVYARLQELPLDYAQGFLVAKPAPLSEAL